MSSGPNPSALGQEVLRRAIPFTQTRQLEPLVERLAQAKVVMLGEATHGTHEFYETRRILTEWLIVKHGFRIVAVEGDWPPCEVLNRYVEEGEGGNAREALEAFERWPTWMWANTEIIRLGEWMRTHNRRVSASQQCSFHGLDVYSLFESMEAVIHSLDRIDPSLAEDARNRYSCFARFGNDERLYARSLLQFPEGCREEVAAELAELLKLRLQGMPRDLFDLRQNARVVANAEDYYRTMMLGTEDSWNVRDRHMMDTLEILLNRLGPEGKAIVWAHNTHIGDYRGTDMLSQGLVNLGGLARERLGAENVALLGFGTYEGTVVASHSWEGPTETLKLPRAREGSLEAVLHETSQSMIRRGPASLFFLMERDRKDGPFSEVVHHRAVGVVYDPKTERRGNYVPTILNKRYDAFLFIDQTRALEPLIQPFSPEEVPETWPFRS